MLHLLKELLSREKYLTTHLSVIINPLYIIRGGLYEAIREFAPSISGRILDFGCGSKPYETLFANATAYIGVDICVSGHDHKDSKVDCFYDGYTLPFPDNHFDAIVSFEVFEHVFNIEQVLNEIRRVLKTDGQLLISIPFAWEEHEMPYDFVRYTSCGIKYILNKNGFVVTDLRKTTTSLMAFCQLFIVYIYQHVLPKAPGFRRISQLVVIFPLNVLSLIFNMVMPKRYDYFSNIVVLSKKESDC